MTCSHTMIYHDIPLFGIPDVVYTWYKLSESLCHKPGINLVYTWFLPAHLKPCKQSCSKIATGMQRHTDFGLPGCLISITARGAPTGHPSALAGTGGRRRGGRSLVTVTVTVTVTVVLVHLEGCAV